MQLQMVDGALTDVSAVFDASSSDLVRQGDTKLQSVTT